MLNLSKTDLERLTEAVAAKIDERIALKMKTISEELSSQVRTDVELDRAEGRKADFFQRLQKAIKARQRAGAKNVSAAASSDARDAVEEARERGEKSSFAVEYEKAIAKRTGKPRRTQ
jgi:hypothetical protein